MCGYGDDSVLGKVRIRRQAGTSAERPHRWYVRSVDDWTALCPLMYRRLKARSDLLLMRCWQVPAAGHNVSLLDDRLTSGSRIRQTLRCNRRLRSRPGHIRTARGHRQSGCLQAGKSKSSSSESNNASTPPPHGKNSRMKKSPYPGLPFQPMRNQATAYLRRRKPSSCKARG
jgi:hypothetical protein